jgi:hypothetical protein
VSSRRDGSAQVHHAETSVRTCGPGPIGENAFGKDGTTAWDFSVKSRASRSLASQSNAKSSFRAPRNRAWRLSSEPSHQLPRNAG